MQRLALARPDPEAVRRWRFALDGKPPVSLTDMAQDRLAMLVEGGGGGGDEPNGLRSYLQGTLGLKQPFAVGPRAVRNLLISIEDERLLGIAAFSSSEERRVGKGWVRKCRSSGSAIQ